MFPSHYHDHGQTGRHPSSLWVTAIAFPYLLRPRHILLWKEAKDNTHMKIIHQWKMLHWQIKTKTKRLAQVTQRAKFNTWFKTVKNVLLHWTEMPLTLLKTSAENQHQSTIHGNISINMTSGRRQETSYSSVVSVILYILKGTKRQWKQRKTQTQNMKGI